MPEQPQQPIIQVPSTPYQSPMNNYGSSILHLTNPEQELYKLELTLRSQILNKDGRAMPMGKPMMNDEGICAIMGLVQVIVNQVTIMSNLDSKKEIPNLIDFLGDTLAKDILVNSKRYGLDPHDKDKVYFAVLAGAYICMKRATETGLSDKKFWRGSVQEISTKVEQPQRSGGILGKITGWNR